MGANTNQAIYDSDLLADRVLLALRYHHPILGYNFTLRSLIFPLITTPAPPGLGR